MEIDSVLQIAGYQLAEIGWVATLICFGHGTVYMTKAIQTQLQNTHHLCMPPLNKNGGWLSGSSPQKP
jgi:hypothetical protein